MPVTSGKYGSNPVTVEQVVKAAMQDIRVLPAGKNPTVNDVTDCAFRLQQMCTVWATKGLMLWLYDIVVVPLVQNKYRYTIGVGGDIDPGYRPLRVGDGSFIRYACQPVPQDVSLQILARTEYLGIANKTQQAIPNQIYYDVQTGPNPNPVSYNPYTQGWGVLYVWPNPADSLRAIHLNVERSVQDQTAAGQTFDCPREWYEPMIICLGARIADMYEVPEPRIARLQARADSVMDEIENWGAQEWAPMRFQPSPQFGMYNSGRGRFR
jgi:hypothetical protein